MARIYYYADAGVHGFWSGPLAEGEEPSIDGFGERGDVYEVPDELWDAYSRASKAKAAALDAIEAYTDALDKEAAAPATP